MGSGRVGQEVKLSEEQRGQLESFASSRSLPHAHVQRAKIVLMAAEGVQNIQIAAQLRTTRETVGKWRQRFIEQGLEGLYDELRPGRPRSAEDERVWNAFGLQPHRGVAVCPQAGSVQHALGVG
jgi:putative transposase